MRRYTPLHTPLQTWVDARISIGFESSDHFISSQSPSMDCSGEQLQYDQHATRLHWRRQNELIEKFQIPENIRRNRDVSWPDGRNALSSGLTRRNVTPHGLTLGPDRTPATVHSAQTKATLTNKTKIKPVSANQHSAKLHVKRVASQSKPS